MAERLHAMTQERSVAERFFWLWIVLAFLLGLIPGLALFAYYRNTANARADQLRSRVAQASSKLAAQEAALTKLRSQLASQEAAAAGGGAGSGSGSASSDASMAPADVAAPPKGTVTFVTREVTPSPANAGGTIALKVVMAGAATDAYMQLKNESGSYSKIWRLKPGAKSGVTQEWTRDDATAPKAAGTYTTFTWAFVGTKRFVAKPAGELTVK